MQGVFDLPVGTDGGVRRRGRKRRTAQVVAGFDGVTVAKIALRTDTHQRGEVTETVGAAQAADAVGIGNRPAVTDFDTTIVLVDGFVDVIGIGGEAALLQVIEEQHHVLVQVTLIAFERQQIVGLLAADLLSNLCLTGHGVNRHQTARQVQTAQQFGEGGDLV